MKLFRWYYVGRKSDVKTMVFCYSKFLGMGLYIGKYDSGGHSVGVSWHVDSQLQNLECSLLPGHPEGYTKIYRANLLIWKAKKGGEFLWRPASEKIFLDSSRLKIFRADNLEHMVTAIEEGTRIILGLVIHRP